MESILPNREGTLFTEDYDGTRYVLKTWTEGRECNIYDKAGMSGGNAGFWLYCTGAWSFPERKRVA